MQEVNSTNVPAEELIHPQLRSQQQAPIEAPDQQPNLEAQQEPQATQEVSYQEKNFRDLRESKARAERERDELQRRLQDMQNLMQPKAPIQEEEEVNLAPDDLVEWKYVEKKFKNLEKQLNAYKEQNSLSSAEQRLKLQYPDFDKVVTKENIEYLQQIEPEMAQTLKAGNDMYAKGVSAYKLLKNMGIYKEDTYADDRKRVQENASKPRSTTAAGAQTGNTPLAQANAFAQGLTPDLQKQLLKEMNEARKAY